MAAAVDTDKAERKVWIVRVPPYVAQQWHAAIARSSQAAIDEDVQPEVLGQVTIEQAVATTLQVPGENGAQVLHMNNKEWQAPSQQQPADTAIFSYEPAVGAAAGTLLQAPKVEGVVHKRYDAAPVRIAEAPQQEVAGLGGIGMNPHQVKREVEQRQRASAMQAQVDSAYLQNSRQRLAAASRPASSRKVALIEDFKEARRLEGGGNISLYIQQREAKQVKLAAADVKRRVRMSRDELEGELFKKFGEQPHWHFVQLQKEIDQPVAYLKEVLNELAIQIKRGPNKDLWELKKQYQGASQYQQRQQPAAQS